MTNLILGTSEIRQLDGLFSLNDLHVASGGEEKHSPNRFMRLDTTQKLADEISKTPDVAFKVVRGRYASTYACRELVIAYAAWISPAFHLKVIRVFLDTHAPASAAPTLPVTAERIARAHAAAGKVVTEISRQVFEAVLGGQDDFHGRWVISSRGFASAIPHDAFVMTFSKLAPAISDIACTASNAELLALAAACIRLAERRIADEPGKTATNHLPTTEKRA